MTNIVLTAEAYAQKLIDTFGNALAAIEGLKAGLDANGRINGLPGTAQLAQDALVALEGLVTDADINEALDGFDIVRRKEDPEAQETLVTYPTPGGFKDAAALVRFLVATDSGNRTVSKVLGWLKAGDRVWASFGYWRAVKTPKRFQALTVDELAAELTQELPGDLIDAQGGRWHVQVTAISHIRPDRALWVYRALANTSDVKPGVLGFYAASLRRAKVELGIEPEGPKGLNVDELQALADLKAAKPALPAITPARAYVIVSRYSSPVIRSAGRRLGDWLSEGERSALVAYIGSDDVALVNAWIEALADLCPPEERKDPAADFRKLQEGHEAFVRAERQAKARADAIAQRSRSLQAFQDSRNALQVAA